MVQIHFSQWLTQFQDYVTQQIKKKENEWKWILFMCNWKWQLFIPFSDYRETDAIKQQQLWHISHHSLQTWYMLRVNVWSERLKNPETKQQSSCISCEFMFRRPWSH